MSFKKNLEEKIRSTEQKLNTFSISLKRLEIEYQQLLEELALTPEQLKSYMENPENFSPLIWEQLQNEKTKLDEKLNLELGSIPDPHKTKKTIAERGNIQQHWLFVR